MTSDLELSKTVMNLSTLLVPVRDSGFRGMFDSKPWNISFQTSIILIHKVRAFGSNDLAISTMYISGFFKCEFTSPDVDATGHDFPDPCVCVCVYACAWRRPSQWGVFR